MRRLLSSIAAIAAMASITDLASAESQTVTDVLENASEMPEICYGIALSDAADFGPY